MSKAVIDSVASCLPDNVLTNESLEAQGIGLTAAQIYEKTGILERHIAGANETASDLAFKAAQKLFAKGSAKPDEINYVLFCTQSPDYYLPTSACVLQERLGLPRSCGALDFNLGCSGYVMGLSLAKGLIESGQASCILLLTGETYWKYINPRDRAVSTLFGDAGTATVIRASDSAAAGLGDFVFGTDGRGCNQLIVPAGGLRTPRSEETAIETPDKDGTPRSANNLFMNGPETFRFAIQAVPQTMNALYQKAGVTKDDVDFFVLHQANRFMLDTLVTRLKLPREKVPYEFEKVGNTVSCTIPIVLERMIEDGMMRSGARCMLVGFGVGYSWAGGFMTWQ